MLRHLFLLAIVMILGLGLVATAQAGGGYGPGESLDQDVDGDGIPNCEDPDYVYVPNYDQHMYGAAGNSAIIIVLPELRQGGNGGTYSWGSGEGDGDGIPNETGDGEWGPGDCTED